MSRFIDFIDPGNSGGSVLIPSTPEREPSGPVLYHCRYCESLFKSPADRTQHELEVHPTRNPLLYINNHQLSATKFTIRDKRSLEHIQIYYAEKIILNNKYVEWEEFKAAITGQNNKFYKVELVNQSIKKTFEIETDIISKDLIIKVDELFYSLFSNNEVDEILISKFIEICRSKYNKAISYVDALDKYLRGIKAKDGTTRHLTFEDHDMKFNQSLEVLRGYKSELAHALTTVMNFNFNRFYAIHHVENSPQLSVAMSFFSRVTGRTIRKNTNAITLAVPVDETTSFVIDLINNRFHQYNFEELKEMIAKVKKTPTTTYDKAKLDFIMYEKALHESRNRDAEKYLKAIKYDEAFKSIISLEN